MTEDTEKQELLDTIVALDKAFCSRHGSFPLDRTNLREKQWNNAMTKARDMQKKHGRKPWHLHKKDPA